MENLPGRPVIIRYDEARFSWLFHAGRPHGPPEAEALVGLAPRSEEGHVLEARGLMRLSLLKLLVLALAITLTPALVACEQPVKAPSVAGSFYPADPDELRTMVDGFLEKAQSAPHEGRLVALVSPHAGYVYSGQVAAYSYKNIGDKRTVIILAPSHYDSFSGASVYTEGSLKTPLGLIRIDERLAKSLVDEKAGVRFYPKAFEKEHSLEVQLPFLQRSLKRFRIVPVIMGRPTRASFDHLATKITKILREDEKAVVIASTDLSHYKNYDETIERDMRVLNALRRLSQGECQRLETSGQGEMCGYMPVMLTLEVARRLGANEAALLKYANSAMTTGDLNRVVGYASVGIYKSPLTEADHETLLKLARDTIARKVTDGDAQFVEMDNPRFQADAAVFVTITKKGRLRGCIGQTSPVMPLYKAVQYSAMQSCATDPRFPPMSKEELDDMKIEISVLSPFSPVDDVRDIVLGRDGLILRKGRNAGIFLPQVPVQEGWDRNTYLERLGLKAGLSKDAWKDGAQIESFTAEVFGEGG
jgi:AmmeMemoRadiSam system protein B/AmmeMemoRadiSam system protein A